MFLSNGTCSAAQLSVGVVGLTFSVIISISCFWSETNALVLQGVMKRDQMTYFSPPLRAVRNYMPQITMASICVSFRTLIVIKHINDV